MFGSPTCLTCYWRLCLFVCVFWQGSVSGLPMHLSFLQRHSNLRVLYVIVICAYFFVCLVIRERFGLAHAPLLSQRHSNLCTLYVIIICAYLFVCLMTRERFRLAHAPLLSQRHSNLRVLYVIVIFSNLFVCLATRVLGTRPSMRKCKQHPCDEESV